MLRKINVLSIVVPCHNEEEALSDTHGRLSTVCKGLVGSKQCTDYEIIYVDNGSTDGTFQALEKIFGGGSKVMVVSLRRNFGYQGSISAGLAHAKGDAVVTIDADLQDPPEKIGEMMEHYQKDYDLVLGVRQSRASDSFLKRFFSQGYYRFLKALGMEVVYNHGDFRLMARELVDEFNRLPERNRFIRALVLRLESRYALVYYDREPRKAGKTKFNLPALLSFSIDGITSFSVSPLRVAIILGGAMCLGAVAGIIWVLYIKINTNVIPGWASTMLPILAFSGFQLIFLGLIGEYIGRLYIEVKQRPLYSVRRKLARK